MPGFVATLLGLATLPYVAAFAARIPSHRIASPATPVALHPVRHSATQASLATAASLVAAKAKAVPFALLGKTSAELFPVQNLALLSWAPLLLLPRWRFTPVLALIAPTVHSALYANVLVHMIKNPTPGLTVDFTSLAGIMPGFAIPDGAFAGWLHYCTFDPLVGLAITMDAKRMRVPHLLVVPCLVATALMGPVGFLSYLLLRTAVRVLRGSVKKDPPKGFEWGKTF